MADKDDLNYTADGIRDTSQNLGKSPDEQGVQASMQEETAIAMHRVAEALEAQNEQLRKIALRIEELPRGGE